MTYTLIGTGNMAWLMASRMSAAGHVCTGIWGRNATALDELCAAFSLRRLRGLEEVHDGPDACIIAVADAGIADVAKLLSLRHTTLLHTAGSISINALAIGSVHAGVVWPVYSIRRAALPAQRAFPAVIEGNTTAALEVARDVAKAICDTIYEASSEQRQWMHLAAVTGNNFVNYLLSIAAGICEEQGLPIALIQPLVEQTIVSARTQHPAELQTGPARRGDVATIEQHVAMLANHPQWRDVYAVISNAIMKESGS